MRSHKLSAWSNLDCSVYAFPKRPCTPLSLASAPASPRVLQTPSASACFHLMSKEVLRVQTLMKNQHPHSNVPMRVQTPARPTDDSQKPPKKSHPSDTKLPQSHPKNSDVVGIGETRPATFMSVRDQTQVKNHPVGQTHGDP